MATQSLPAMASIRAIASADAGAKPESGSSSYANKLAGMSAMRGGHSLPPQVVMTPLSFSDDSPAKPMLKRESGQRILELIDID